MTTKITVNIDSKLAKRINRYARSKKKTIDSLIEEQMKAILMKDENIAPAVKELGGILKSVKVKDIKEEYGKHLIKKHGK